uniref:Helicase domino n=1 Tax=Timema douglasi TaxID=61478 RepID=A0A7R8VMH2_TIMDO|nr:unnamed protein product [Timema douglasi]
MVQSLSHVNVKSSTVRQQFISATLSDGSVELNTTSVLANYATEAEMSDVHAGGGNPQAPTPPHALGVSPGQTVRLQQVLSAAAAGQQNVNVLTTRGQQFVITSHVSVPGLTQVIPTNAANATLQQAGVTRILNIAPSPRLGAGGMPGRPAHSGAPGAERGGTVSLVAIGQPGGVNASSHPTLVSSLSSPPRPRPALVLTTSPVGMARPPPPQVAPFAPPAVSQISGSPTTVARKRLRLVDLQEKPPPNEDIAALRKRILERRLAQSKWTRGVYAEHAAELFFLQAGGNMMDYHAWRKRAPTPQFLHFLRSHRLDPEDDDEDLTVLLSGESPCATTRDISTLLGHQQLDVYVMPVERAHPTTAPPAKLLKRPFITPMCRQHTRQHSISDVYDNSIGSQEQIAEKAKQRIVELQRDGLWSEKRLPKVQEPPRAKAHWDYLVEEMVWLAADFAQERKWKKAAAKKCARNVQKYFQEKEIQAQKAEKGQEQRLRKIASFAAKEIKTFWANVEKLVEFKQQTRLEEKRKQALDQHLSFIVDQTEKYSTWLAASMNKSNSVNSSPSKHSVISDDDFQPNVSSTDDEETIAKAEEDMASHNHMEEIELLKRESELPIEELIKKLPEKYLENIGTGDLDDLSSQGDDDDFTLPSDKGTTDDEETIQEQESRENKVDHKKELADLEAENEQSIEELRAKYGSPKPVAFSSDEDEEPSDREDEETLEDEESEGYSSESEQSESEDVGLKSLLESNVDSAVKANEEEPPEKEFNDVSALAESIQPTGNTLSSTSVVTKIPFLLKHTLREYQHIGLDWLVTMFDRKLNGILADEMGLGKTIQTISLLAHLACEKVHLTEIRTSISPSSAVGLNMTSALANYATEAGIFSSRYSHYLFVRLQQHLGTTLDNSSNFCDVKLGNGVQKVVPGIQDSHLLWNPERTKTKKNRRLLLTGTPLQNNLMELWSLMHFLMPSVFQSHREFKEWFSNPVTGMIEGNAEYNENLIKRLHKIDTLVSLATPNVGSPGLLKVLRPFLLRRLKVEVEKQLPKKYEHVVMCRLSKRQRYLYDDFMSRAKTKETLSSGNLLSVINVLMQLRKVCNHPNLFEVRPIISPFQMECITYHTASLVYSGLDYDPLKDLDLSFLNMRMVDLELFLTAFVAHRIKKFRANRSLFQQLEVLPASPRCPSGKIKINIRVSNNTPQQQLVKALSIMSPRVGTSPVVRTIGPQAGGGVTLRRSVGTPLQGHSVQLVQHQAEVKGIPVTALATAQHQSLSVKPANVQKISLPGFTLVHTSVGPQLLLTTSSQSHPVQGTTTVMTPSGQRLSVLPNNSGVGQVVSRVATGTTMARPLVRGPSQIVRPVLNNNTHPANLNAVIQPMLSATVVRQQTATTRQDMVRFIEQVKIKQEPGTETKSVFYLPKLEELRRKQKLDRLNLINRLNQRRCDAYPIYGPDLVETLRLVDRNVDKSDQWRSGGYMHCRHIHYSLPRNLGTYWTQTDSLRDCVKTLQQRMDVLADIFSRFILCVPAVLAPLPALHVSHPSPSKLWGLRRSLARMQKELSLQMELLHPIISAMGTQFPDPRLIQYDCGKLQVLDKLLRQLKVGHHRALIFTQMTRMLDVLEAFLNHHGHIYLRLDGSTRVDQRQMLMERFNADPRIFCFILSTRSGGIGVNLTGADTVIFYDSDWNPTMDAQAQDRCHRIGQTRDVHIYRLVSEMTVEENILKKANQKRLLGDLAIEGGNFTTAYFKSTTIQDLFNIDVNEQNASRRMAEVLDGESERENRRLNNEAQASASVEEKAVMGVLESALAAAEDDTDVQAARTAKAEAAAELAEFDESIPLEDGASGEGAERSLAEPEISRAEQEVRQLVDQLTPVERYAMRFMEETEATWSAEQLAAAEAEIEQQKHEWEMGRLRALQDEEERRARLTDEDDVLLTFSSEDAHNQVNTGSGRARRMRRRHSRADSTTSEDKLSSTEEEEDSSSSEELRKARLGISKLPLLNNHTTPRQSPRTRSRGSVRINLWRLEMNPNVPDDRIPVAPPPQTSTPRAPPRGAVPGQSRRPSTCSDYLTDPPFPDPKVVIRTRRASVTRGDSLWRGEPTPKKSMDRIGRITRRSESCLIEGNGPIS